MKKYITLAALLTAGTAFASAENLLPELMSNDTRTDVRVSDKTSSWVDILGTSAATNASNAASIANCLSSSQILSSTGWSWAVSNNDNGAYSNDSDGVMRNVSDTGFTIVGRGAYTGSFVAATANLKDILSVNETLTEVSVSFTASSVNQLYFSLWSWNGSAATLLGADSQISAGDNVSVTAKNLTLSSADTVFALWGSNTRGNTSEITNLSSSATVIPEPSAFGLLAGLGALALVGARRRRRV